MRNVTKLIWIQLMVLFMAAAMFLSGCKAVEEASQKSRPAADIYDGWRLSLQCWTFNKMTFYEAVDKAASLGLAYVEAYPGQRLSKEKPSVKFVHPMSPEIRNEVKQKLAQARVKLVNYGMVELPNDEAKCRQVFDFAKEMGIETIVSEPPEEAFAMIDKLCEEYKINVAIHNHPKPSHYWNPDTVLKACEGRSRRIGACIDTGHWMRSGINPLEAIKKLQGRIISAHFKDLDEFGNKNAVDVVWGTGRGDANAMLAELDRQKFKGVFSIEYEKYSENLTAEVQKCVEYFNKVAAEMSPREWRNLLADNLSNCVYKPGSWDLDANGVLNRKGGGDIWTKERYGNFILDFEFKVAKGANSGVFIRTGSIENWLNTAIEVQIHETTDGTKHGACGAIYDCLSPSKNVVKKAGEWNHYVITCLNNKIYVVLNGEQIIDMDLNLWTEAHKNPDGTPNKFTTAYKDMPRIGYIGLQDHGDPVWFRNLRIKSLD